LKEIQQQPARHLPTCSSSPNNQKRNFDNKPNLGRMSAPKENIHMNISFYTRKTHIGVD